MRTFIWSIIGSVADEQWCEYGSRLDGFPNLVQDLGPHINRIPHSSHCSRRPEWWKAVSPSDAKRSNPGLS
jgi:hypothetical protein